MSFFVSMAMRSAWRTRLSLNGALLVLKARPSRFMLLAPCTVRPLPLSVSTVSCGMLSAICTPETPDVSRLVRAAASTDTFHCMESIFGWRGTVVVLVQHEGGERGGLGGLDLERPPRPELVLASA